MVNAVDFHLVQYLVGVLQRLGYITEHAVHFFLSLEPLLFAVEHDIFILERLACREADESFMGIGILLIDEVRVVGANEFDVQFLGEFNQCFVDQALFLVCFVIGTGNGCFVPL